MSRIYVGNVSSKANIQELKDLLAEVGKIKFFGINSESGYMEFETPEEADEAIKKFNGYSFNGKALVVEPARKSGFRGGYKSSRRPSHREHRRSRSRSSKSSSRSKSRSRSRTRKRRNHDRSKSKSRSPSRSRSRDRTHKKRSKKSRSRSRSRS